MCLIHTGIYSVLILFMFSFIFRRCKDEQKAAFETATDSAMEVFSSIYHFSACGRFIHILGFNFLACVFF